MTASKNIIDFPDEYIMIDVETTGFSPEWDSLIELGALKIKNGEIVDRFESFVHLDEKIPDNITQLTGITDDMLINAPDAQNAVRAFVDFIGDNVIVGYNVGFDINFIRHDLNKYFNQEMNNDFIDCMRIARKLFPDEPHHKLKDMRRILNIAVPQEHRASYDCITTKEVFESLKEKAIKEYGDIEAFRKTFSFHSVKARDISSQNKEFDTTHPFYGKTCVFTGTLEKMVRKDAMQAVADVGGKNGDNVTKETNFLILGNNDYCAALKGGKSNKQKKAEALMLKGQDIAIIPENVFYEILDSYGGRAQLKTDSNMFGCCSKYKECSETKKCIRNDERSLACWYRKNLEAGKVFY